MDVPSASPKEAASKLKKLPKWAWIVAAAVALVIYLYMRHQQAQAAAAAAISSTDTTSPTDPNATSGDTSGYNPNQDPYGQSTPYPVDIGGGMGNSYLPSGAGAGTPPANITINTGGGPPKRPNNHHGEALKDKRQEAARDKRQEAAKDKRQEAAQDRRQKKTGQKRQHQTHGNKGGRG